jgi:hemoglobin
MTPLARIDISPAQIHAVTARFYARLRQDPTLGPVFHAAIGREEARWEAHVAKISRFWRNALLREPVYDGNPMQVHAANGAVRPEHFALWLAHFDATLAEVLPPELAAPWSRLAHRIGRGLSLGLEAARQRRGDAPSLAG